MTHMRSLYIIHSKVMREGQVFEIKVPGVIIFGPKEDKGTRIQRKLYNNELYDLYFSRSIIWVIMGR
jgi:hypothetical protein